MTQFEFKIDDNKIEFVNSIFGKETIRLNGKTVTEKYSISGAEHRFNLNNENFKIISSYNSFKNRDIKLDLIKDSKIIQSNSFKTSSMQRIMWMAMGFALVLILIKLIELT